MHDTPFVVAGRTFSSRLIVGTAKYGSFRLMAEAHAASAADMVAEAMKHAVIAGRLAFLAGRIPRKTQATASSPVEGLIR
jgi:thiazole synthase ThiGH ThiG subunit